MPHSSRVPQTQFTPPPASFPAPDLAALAAPLLDAQRRQWNDMLQWQESLVVACKDFWEQWACRFAGGVPLDG